MPIRKTIHDKVTGEALVRDALTAAEAVANDPARYSYRPWKNVGAAARDEAKLKAADKNAKAVDGQTDA